jgi:hypothetical protein
MEAPRALAALLRGSGGADAAPLHPRSGAPPAPHARAAPAAPPGASRRLPSEREQRHAAELAQARALRRLICCRCVLCFRPSFFGGSERIAPSLTPRRALCPCGACALAAQLGEQLEAYRAENGVLGRALTQLKARARSAHAPARARSLLFRSGARPPSCACARSLITRPRACVLLFSPRRAA